VWLQRRSGSTPRKNRSSALVLTISAAADVIRAFSFYFYRVSRRSQPRRGSHTAIARSHPSD
jgi:hypothetical protein